MTNPMQTPQNGEIVPEQKATPLSFEDILKQDNECMAYLKVGNMKQAISQAYQRGREELLSELDIIWVCPPCAKQFFNRGYTEGKTNIYTAVHRNCEACHQQNQCMHYRSYDE